MLLGTWNLFLKGSLEGSFIGLIQSMKIQKEGKRQTFVQLPQDPQHQTSRLLHNSHSKRISRKLEPLDQKLKKDLYLGNLEFGDFTNVDIETTYHKAKRQNGLFSHDEIIRGSPGGAVQQENQNKNLRGTKIF
nr:hypothetical protein CFP56_58936 [Quercus suber]